MRISSKGRYAVRLMLDLAIHNDGSYIPMKDIAERQEISEKYLEQIIAILRKAGCVDSFRGASGGYRLAKAPKEYTIGEILRLTEGTLAPVACLDKGASCDRKAKCVTVRLWGMVSDAVDEVVDSITLADLLCWQREQDENTCN